MSKPIKQRKPGYEVTAKSTGVGLWLLLLIRTEILVTIGMDAASIWAAVAMRGFFLAQIHKGTAPEAINWALRLMDWILDVGLVGTVLAIAVFDLAKRIRRSYRSFKYED